MPSHSEEPGIWLSVWRFLLTHCLYERAAKVLARPRGCAGSPEPSLLAYAISTKFAWRGPITAIFLVSEFSGFFSGIFSSSNIKTWQKKRTKDVLFLYQNLVYFDRGVIFAWFTAGQSIDEAVILQNVLEHRRTVSMTCAPREDSSLHYPHKEAIGPKRTAKLIRLGKCLSLSESHSKID